MQCDVAHDFGFDVEPAIELVAVLGILTGRRERSQVSPEEASAVRPRYVVNVSVDRYDVCFAVGAAAVVRREEDDVILDDRLAVNLANVKVVPWKERAGGIPKLP